MKSNCEAIVHDGQCDQVVAKAVSMACGALGMVLVALRWAMSDPWLRGSVFWLGVIFLTTMAGGLVIAARRGRKSGQIDEEIRALVESEDAVQWDYDPADWRKMVEGQVARYRTRTVVALLGGAGGLLLAAGIVAAAWIGSSKARVPADATLGNAIVLVVVTAIVAVSLTLPLATICRDTWIGMAGVRGRIWVGRRGIYLPGHYTALAPSRRIERLEIRAGEKPSLRIVFGDVPRPPVHGNPLVTFLILLGLVVGALVLILAAAAGPTGDVELPSDPTEILLPLPPGQEHQIAAAIEDVAIGQLRSAA